MTPPVLRPYQRKLVDELIVSLDAGEKPVAQAATGAGKSHILGEVARHYLEQGIPVTLLCHRREILLHLQRVLREHTGLEPSLISADGKSNWDAPLVVGMVPTISRRLKTTPTDRGGVLLLDEAHHAPSPSWQKVIGHLAPDHLAGVTATPISCNRRPLGETFDRLLIGPPSELLVADGHLAPVRLLAAERLVDVKGVHVRQGDYAIGELEGRVAAIQGEIIPTWLRYAEGRPTLVACCSLSHSRSVAELYREAGIAAAHVDGSTPTPERDRILRDFAQGAITVLTFMGLIDEGLDIPEASVLQFLRPTKSVRLRRQLEGRIRRPHFEKRDCVILDHSDSWRTLPLPDEVVRWRLDAPAESGAEVVRSQGEKPVRRPTGEIALEVPARFREITRRKRNSIVGRLEDPRRADWLLDALATGRLKRWPVIEELKVDREAGLAHFRMVGKAVGFKHPWSHHQYADAVSRSTRRPLREVLDRRLREALEQAVEAKRLGSRVIEPGVVTVAGQRHGRVVLAVGLASGAGVPFHRHHTLKAQLATVLEPALGPIEVVGLFVADPPLRGPGSGPTAQERAAAMF